MITKDTLDALQESNSILNAATALETVGQTHNVVALPSDYKLHDMEKYLPMRNRACGTMETNSLDSFVEYSKTHAEFGATVFVNQNSMSATSVLNLGNATSDAGHADNLANLQLKKTAAYSALLGIATGTGHKQATVAEFLEDWPDEVSCFNTDGPIANAKAIAAVRKLTIEAMRKLESSEQSLSATRSAFESVQATSADPIPTTIAFKCIPYADLSERTFVMRLAILTGNDKPAISLRISKAEEAAEQMAQELADAITVSFEAEDCPIPVLLGSYSKS